jgi:hypothetical protein
MMLLSPLSMRLYGGRWICTQPAAGDDDQTVNFSSLCPKSDDSGSSDVSSSFKFPQPKNSTAVAVVNASGPGERHNKATPASSDYSAKA